MRSLPRTAVAACVAGLVLAAMWWAWPRGDPPPPLPELDLGGLEPRVADKIERLVRGLEAAPASAARWGELAMSLDVHDLRRESIACYARAAELDPGEVRWPYYAAIALEDMGSDESLAFFERARELAPDHPPLHVRHGRALLDRGRLEDAARAFGRARELAPASSHAHLGLAQTALARDRPEAALEHLLRAIEAAPGHGEVLGLLSEVYRRLGRPDDARRALRAATRSPAETPLPDPLLGPWTRAGVSVFWHLKRGHFALERGDFQAAVRELEPALAESPNAREYSNLGVAWRRLGKLAEAEASFRAALALEPSHGEALVNLGSTLRALGRSEEAIVHVEKAVAAAPELVEGHLNLGVLYMETGRFGEAADAFRAGLERVPGDLRVALRLAWLLATATADGVRDGTEAVRLAQEVCDADPRPVAPHLDVLAAAHAEAGAFERAAATAVRARDLALAEGRSELARRIGDRLEGYRAGRPWRQPASHSP